MICCTENGLPEALYVLYIHTFNSMQMQTAHADKRINTADCDSGKRQTGPVVRESTSEQQACNRLTTIKIWSWVLYSKTDWPTDRRS
jgi:hypothetical protein